MNDKIDLQYPDCISKTTSGDEIIAGDGLRVTNPRLAAIMVSNKVDPGDQATSTSTFAV